MADGARVVVVTFINTDDCMIGAGDIIVVGLISGATVVGEEEDEEEKTNGVVVGVTACVTFSMVEFNFLSPLTAMLLFTDLVLVGNIELKRSLVVFKRLPKPLPRFPN